MSVSEVVSKASDPSFDSWYPPKNWFRTAEVVFKQGNVYLGEGNLQAAYFLLYRHARLVLEELPSHPQAKDPQYRKNWAVANKEAEQSLKQLEQLKPRINKRYERYLSKRKEAHLQTSKERRSEQELHFDSPGGENFKILDPSEHADVGVRIANAQTSTRHTASTLEGKPQPRAESDDLESMMHNIRRRFDQDPVTFPPGDYSAARSGPLPITYRYPTIQTRVDQSKGDSSIRRGSDDGRLTHAPPIPPRKLEEFVAPPVVPPKAPHIPPKSHGTPPKDGPFVSSNAQLSSSSSRSSTPVPPLEQFKLISKLEGGSLLRTVFLPRELRHSFLRLAHSNTARGLETLGLLCGNLLRNALFITALLLPPQTSTSDTCEMTDEGEIIVDEFISAHSAPDPTPSNDSNGRIGAKATEMDEQGPRGDMMVLGWIHTHPTQTCFLSSRDLHTHVWYQSDLPESVAIVCAPSKSPGLGSEWNAFRLTDPPGLGTIRNCKREGIFHPHDEGDGGIYTDVIGRPGHVIEVANLDFEVCDLRTA